MASGPRPNSQRTVLPNRREIVRLRKAKGLTQEELSEKTGINLKTLKKIEAKEGRGCYLDTIKKLAKYFEVELSHVLVGISPDPTLISDVTQWNTHIVQEAKEILVMSGSRSRDEQYLDSIVDLLRDNPKIIHYRVLFGLPYHECLKAHLYKLLHLRSPEDRRFGHKTLHIALYEEDSKRQFEANICANESTALVVLPSFRGFGQYDTAVVFTNPEHVSGYIQFIKDLYLSAVERHPLESIDSINNLQVRPSFNLRI